MRTTCVTDQLRRLDTSSECCIHVPFFNLVNARSTQLSVSSINEVGAIQSFARRIRTAIGFCVPTQPAASPRRGYAKL